MASSMLESAAVLRIGRVMERSCANGPGERCVVWVQGCPLRCPGCFNRAFWPPEGGELVPVEELAARINGIRSIRGVTLSGGEPMEQAAAVAELLDLLDPRLDLVMFTGYTCEEIAAAPIRKLVLGRVDLAVVGRYMRELASEDDPWTGSRNKEALEVTGRIRRDEPPDCRVEVNISAAGEVLVTGFPPAGI